MIAHEHLIDTFLYLEVNAIALALLGIIRYRTLGVSRMIAQRNFSMAMDSQMLQFIADCLCMLIENHTLNLPPLVLLLGKTVYFMSTGLLCYFWFVYFEYLQDSPFTRSRRAVFCSSGLLWVIGTLLLTNLFTGLLFYVDDGGLYHRGPLFILLYLLSYAYVLFTSFRALLGICRDPNGAKSRLLTTLALFPVLPAIAGIVQFRFSELPLVCAALALETLVMYLLWIDEMISVDPLTRLSNRKQLEYNFKQWQQGSGKEESLYLLLIDANRFKSINDTYGHTEGDAALVRIADALRGGCRNYARRCVSARYGGDEFVVLAQADSAQEVETLRGCIEKALDELNRAAHTPYDVSVSFGVARVDAELPLKDLIAQADEQLYAEKREQHRELT